jgi:hypothetical protein
MSASNSKSINNINSSINNNNISVNQNKPLTQFDYLLCIQNHLDSRWKPNAKTKSHRFLSDELDDYFQLPNIGITEDVFLWWSTKQNHFPRLAKLAFKCLIIPTTSASSKPVFSTAGYILNQKRSRSTGDHLHMLIFHNSYFKDKKGI